MKADEFKSHRYLIRKDSLDSNNPQWVLELLPDGIIQSEVWTEYGMNRDISQNPIQQEQWHHIVRTWDGKSMSLYIDGVLESTKETTGNYLIGNSGNIILGGGQSNDYTSKTFDGGMDNLDSMIGHLK